MTKKDPEKAERRRQEREARRAAERQAATQARRRGYLVWGAAGLLILAVIGVVVAANRPVAGPGERVPVLANRSHIPPGTMTTEYNSNPPTSGPHWATTATWGVHTEVLPDELLVHNLEHAGVWISYKDPKDTELAANLAAIAGRYRTKVVVTPRPKNDAPIAVAAWGRLLKLQSYDEDQIVRFINAYRTKVGPERNVP